ncbi:hypothetical protein [Methylobacterium sp. 391_Methyba4]|nr:hypothetical protein [Methylobacterium sp. 391_Methyba4]WFS10454.1 hypothetical protein P9K36_14740 [Methylobacterium sp. 391_Methyba4]
MDNHTILGLALIAMLTLSRVANVIRDVLVARAEAAARREAE